MDNYGGLYNSDEPNQYSDDDDDGGGFSLRNAVVDELGSDLKRSLKIDNYHDNKRNLYYEEEEDEEEDDGDMTEALLVQMGYGKRRPAMPPVEEVEVEEDGDITEDLLNQMGYGKTGPPKHEPPATPVPADNLKSAMKGSSKKEELPDKERKVTWAEDVYDPIPSAASHFATNRSERHRTENKKSGKNRQKWGGKGGGGGAKGGKDKDTGGGKDKEKKQGGGGKGGKEKDKKQVKKFSGKSTRKCFDTLDEDDTLVDFGNERVGYDSFY